MPQDVPSTFDRRMLELVKKFTSSLMLNKVLVREENRPPVTKNINTISLCKDEKKKVEVEEKVIDKNMIKHDKDSERNVESIEESIRIATKEPVVEQRKLIELPEPQPEDERKLLIRGKPFLTTARAEIKFDKATISLRFGKRKISFYKWIELCYQFKESKENEINALSVVNERILEWEERIIFYRELELEFKEWKSKFPKNNELKPKEESSSGSSENQRGVNECEIRCHPGKANVVADALSKKERVKPRRVRAIAMTIQSGVRGMILAAQGKVFKQKNVLAERLHGLDQQMKRKEDESL
nr:reverse transcriptase domain-containing protein [Tanacetum cinerariifolium]